MNPRSLVQSTPVALAACLVTAPLPASTIIDISSRFNRDTLAVSASEPRNGGYRNRGEVFIADRFFSNPFNSVGGTLPNPNLSGFSTITSGGRDYQIGPYDSASGFQPNTWVLDVGQAEVLEFATPQRWSDFGVLFSGVGYNPTNNNNATVTVHYTDNSSGSFIWDVADSNGAGLGSGLNPATRALSGLSLANRNTQTFPGVRDRSWFVQDFSGLDTSRLISRIVFSTARVGDSGSDADFGIYAISATVIPEPATAGVLLSGAGCLLSRRRRR